MMHLSREDLIRLRDVDALPDRDRILAHLAACAACSALCAELVRTRPLGEDAESEAAVAGTFDPQPFLEAGYRARRIDRRAWRLFDWRLGLAAVAALIVAVILIPRWPERTGQPEAVLRGGASRPTAIRPVDVTVDAAAVAFEWTADSTPGRNRLTVVDLTNPSAPVIARDVGASPYAPTPEERVRLTSGREYHWFVEHRDERGVTTTSAAARFRVR